MTGAATIADVAPAEQTDRQTGEIAETNGINETGDINETDGAANRTSGAGDQRAQETSQLN
jgi:hypothetical protein